MVRYAAHVRHDLPYTVGIKMGRIDPDNIHSGLMEPAQESGFTVPVGNGCNYLRSLLQQVSCHSQLIFSEFR